MGSIHQDPERSNQENQTTTNVEMLHARIKQGLHLTAVDHSDPENEPANVTAALDALRAVRLFTKAAEIPGAKCLPFYDETYSGTFNTSVSKTLQEIIPGFTAPDQEQIDKLENWKTSDPERAEMSYGTLNSPAAAVVQNIVKAMHPRTMFEFGTHQGILAERMMEAVPDDAVLLTLDLPPSELDRAKIPVDKTNLSYVKHEDDGMGMHVSAEHEDRVVRLHGDSYNFDARQFKGKMDLVVVDGSHQYEVVKKDLKNAWDMLGSGGVMLVDDYKLLRTEGVVFAVGEHKRETGAAAYLLSFFGDIETDLVLFVKP